MKIIQNRGFLLKVGDIPIGQSQPIKPRPNHININQTRINSYTLKKEHFTFNQIFATQSFAMANNYAVPIGVVTYGNEKYKLKVILGLSIKAGNFKYGQNTTVFNDPFYSSHYIEMYTKCNSAVVLSSLFINVQKVQWHLLYIKNKNLLCLVCN